MNFRTSCLFIFLLYSLSYVFAQTFQYSRGWTNGKRKASSSSKEITPCQLQRIKSLLEGKHVSQLYWPCDWNPIMEAAALSRQMKNVELPTLPAEAPPSPDIEKK